MLERVWRKGTPPNCWWEYKLVQPQWKIVWQLLKKTKIDLLYDPAIPLLGIYPEKTKTLNLKRYMHLYVQAELFTIAKNGK